jgi:hypothetical protein
MNEYISLSFRVSELKYLPQQATPSRRVTSLSIAPACKLLSHQSGTVCLRGQTCGPAVHPNSATLQSELRIPDIDGIRNVMAGLICLH